MRHVLGDFPWGTGKAADVPDEIDYVRRTLRQVIECA
jgi:hypothetical protein